MEFVYQFGGRIWRREMKTFDGYGVGNCEFMKMVKSQEVYLRTENKTERKGSG